MKKKKQFLSAHIQYSSLGNAGLCRQIVQTSQIRDVEWASNTCTLNFSTLGIWPEGADGTDINTCAKANQSSLLATGDDFGKVKVFAFPASNQKVRLVFVIHILFFSSYKRIHTSINNDIHFYI